MNNVRYNDKKKISNYILFRGFRSLAESILEESNN